ncbi:MAG TPA: hypothetical protein VM075_03175 [Anaerolineae bacterium]|nr:hypothetical protein [Anaerolineae bacterium]
MISEIPVFKSARSHIVALGGYVLLALVMTYPLAAHFGAAIPGDGFDGWMNYWNLWWVKTALLDLQQSPYFTHYLYYPTGCSLLFQNMSIFDAFLALPLQLVLGLTASYNFVVLFSFVVGGYGAYLLALHILRTKNGEGAHAAAFLAGVVFSFSPFHFAHLLGHLQVISLEWLPFYALCLVASLSSPRLRIVPHIVLPVVFLVLTALCDWYYLLYLLIFTLAYVFYQLSRRRAPQLPLLKAVMVLAVAGLILSPLLVPMVAEALRDSSYLGFPFRTTMRLSADLLAFVTPNELHPIWGPAATRLSQVFSSSTSERMVFAGYIPLALAGHALYTRRREAAFWLVSCLVFFILALGPYLHVAGRQLPIPLPYLGLYRLVPFFSIARSVSRFDVMVMLSLAVLAALGLQGVLRGLPARRGIFVASLGVALVCLEFLPVPYPLTEVEVPSFYESLAAEPEEYAILELPMDWDRPAHLLYQTVHHKPIIAGYVSRRNPLSLADRLPVMQHFRFLGPDIIAQDPKEIAPEVFGFLGARYVILHEYMLPPGREREATLALVEAVFGGQVPVYEDGRITVYLVEGQPGDSPFLVLGQGWGERQVRDGVPSRVVGSEATLAIVCPVDAVVNLNFGALAEEGTRSLEVLLDEQLIGEYQIDDQSGPFTADALSLKAGVHTLRFLDRGDGKPGVVFLSLNLSDNAGEA